MLWGRWLLCVVRCALCVVHCAFCVVCVACSLSGHVRQLKIMLCCNSSTLLQANKMETKASLNPTCVAAEPDWRECMFSETALKYTKTPLFTMNSMYNFGEWEMLAPTTAQDFPPDTTAPPDDWAACWPVGMRTAYAVPCCMNALAVPSPFCDGVRARCAACVLAVLRAWYGAVSSWHGTVVAGVGLCCQL